MPSYFVRVMAQEYGIAFVFDSEQNIEAKNWGDTLPMIFEAANQAFTRADMKACDPKTMSVIGLSRL